MFQFLLQLVGVATLAPRIHRDGVLATGQRHPLLPLVVAWTVEQSLLLAVGSGTPLDALRRERREAVGREHSQTAVRLSLSFRQFLLRSQSQQRAARTLVRLFRWQLNGCE